MSKDKIFIISLIMVIGLTVSLTLAQTAPPAWFTVDNGGGTSTNSRFGLVGSIGQVDASQVAKDGNGRYQVVGGFWGTALMETPFPDVLAPTGSIVSPVNNSRLETDTVEFSVEVTDNDGGSGVDRVLFYVYYNGKQHEVGIDTTAPYAVTWQKPADLLRSQRIHFRAQFFDKADNTAYSTVHGMNYIEAVIEPDVIENWIPEERRAYLNQRSLSPNPDNMCGAASSAMSLAMENVIGRDYNSLATKAEQIYRVNNPLSWVLNQLRNNGVTSNYHCEGTDRAWDIIKLHINNGNPVIILNNRFNFGHYFVAVGYHERNGSRQMIAYDPYGQWLGSGNRYNLNTNSPDSYRGRWVFYDFNAMWGYASQACPGTTTGWLLTVDSGRRLVSMQEFDGIPTTPPDFISDEPDNFGIYEGIQVDDSIEESGGKIYLPIVIK